MLISGMVWSLSCHYDFYIDFHGSYYRHFVPIQEMGQFIAAVFHGFVIIQLIHPKLLHTKGMGEIINGEFNV